MTYVTSFESKNIFETVSQEPCVLLFSLQIEGEK